MRSIVCAGILAAAIAIPGAAAQAQSGPVDRGRYLVMLGGCIDCHTPGYFFGKPDKDRHLAGSEVGFEIPGVGFFWGPNLTPDKDTGLGDWTTELIITALRTGVRPDGRILSPIMPWPHFASLTLSDAQAIAAYLKSLPPVKNKVPGPLGASEKPPSFVMKIVPP